MTDDAPRQSFRLLRAILPKRLQPLARGLRKRLLREGYRPEPPFNVVYSFTQTSRQRQDTILATCRELIAREVPGAFVECGVLDGGTAAIMAWAARGTDRQIHLFDAWQGLPETTGEDGAGARRWVGDVVGSPARVRSVLRRVGARMECVHLHAGWFHDTFPDAAPRVGRVAFLHIDCDFYAPTKLCLETWFERLSPGGCVQIDDYLDFRGSRTAVDEFLSEHPEIDLVIGEGGGAPVFFRKPLPAEAG